ncbi:MAG: hypothetical protein ACXWMW_10515 [Syntrophales bacterium]
MDKIAFRKKVEEWHEWFQIGQKNWSFVYHVSVFGSIICSIAAGALLQVKSVDLVGLSSVLTSMAAVLTSLAAAGGFERKWRSNRLSRSRVDCLLIDIDAENPNLPDLIDQLKDIIIKHDQEIVKMEIKEPVVIE